MGRYLSIFDNSSFDISRKSVESIFIEEPYLNIFGGIQPKVLADTMGLNQMRNNGFAQRFIFVFPDNVTKPHYKDTIPNVYFLKKYDNLIEYLYNTQFGTLFFARSARALEAAIFI